MKKLKLLSLLVLPAITLPVAFNITSCSALGSTMRIIDVNSKNQKYFSGLKSNTPSLHSLLWGDKSFNDGNYVLFITRSTFDDGVDFLLDTNIYIEGEDPVVYSRGASSRSLIDATEKNLPEYDLLRNYQYVSLIETDRNETFNKDGEPSPQQQICTPFDKYTQKDEDANDNHKKDDYVRNDKQAKEYRNLIGELKSLFDSSMNDEMNFFALQWVKGYPVKSAIKTDVFADNTAFCGWLSANDTTGESWK